MKIKRYFFIFMGLSVTVQPVFSQCCSGGSPIAGGTSQGVLQKNQWEVNMNHQFMYSDVNSTRSGDSVPDVTMFFGYRSNYLYPRIAYGLSEKLTLSFELGYYINRTKMAVADTFTGNGISDLIIFPRYDVFNKKTENHQTEVTIGIGSKIPLGRYDLVNQYIINQTTGDTLNILYKPWSTQPSTGTNDFIFYTFFYRGYFKHKLSCFSTFIYILRGTNPLGQSIGDVINFSLFVSKGITKNFSAMIQVKGEKVWPLLGDRFLPSGIPNFSTEINTGGYRLALAPQVNYTYRQKHTAFLIFEFPIYQFVNGTQLTNKFTLTAGVNTRFFLKDKIAGLSGRKKN